MRNISPKRKAQPTGVVLTPVVAPPIVAPVVDIEALNRYRLENGLTFRELSDRVRIKQTTLYAVLRGRVRTKLRDTTAYRLHQFVATHNDAPTTGR